MNTAPASSGPIRTGPVNTQFSGSIPRNYDQHLGPLFFEPFAQDLGAYIEVLGPSAVLELACGTGRLTRHLATRLASSTRIVATDINPAMLAHAQRSLPVDRLEWNTVDAVTLPYFDASFDLVVVQFGVMFYSDRAQAYREALRVLRPGGRLLFTCWNTVDDNPVAQLTQAVVHAYFPVDPPAFYTVPFSYHDRILIREQLLTAGFRHAQLELLALEGTAATAADAATGLLEGSPIHTAITDRDAGLLPRMHADLQARLAERFGDHDLRVPLSAWLVEASK